MKYMLDTNIISYAAKNNPPHVLYMIEKNMKSGICISTIAFAELQYGLLKRKGNIDKLVYSLMLILSNISVLDFNRLAAEEYGKIRVYLESRGTPIGDHDMLIAAHARASELTVVTHNIREFERVPGLNVEDWYNE